MAAEAGSTAKRVNSEELYNPLTVSGEEEGNFEDVDGFGSQPPSQQAPPQALDGGKGRGPGFGEQDQRKSQLFCLALVILTAAVAGTVLLLAVLRSGGGNVDDDDDGASELARGPPTFFLVETIPIVNFSLALAPGALNTFEVLTSMVDQAEDTLDISVMYWNLIASEDDDYDDALEGAAACAEFGCERGQALYDAMKNAVCERSVAIRFLQDNSTSSLSGLGELNELARFSKGAGCAGSVTIRGWDAKAWYDGGM